MFPDISVLLQNGYDFISPLGEFIVLMSALYVGRFVILRVRSLFIEPPDESKIHK